MVVTILYFAWVRERVGMAEERLDIPAGVATVQNLVEWLAGRSEGHRRAFADISRVRAAIDQQFTGFDSSIDGAREIAFFPPVTGG